MSEERLVYSTEEAISLLPDGEYIHTFRQAIDGPFPIILGADLSRAELISAIQKYGAEASGEIASSMGHGMALIDDKGALFIQTRGSAGERWFNSSGSRNETRASARREVKKCQKVHTLGESASAVF